MFVYDEYMESVPISLLLGNFTVFLNMCLCELDLDKLEHWRIYIVDNILIFLYVILLMNFVHQLFL